MPRMLFKVNYKSGSFHIGDLLKNIKLVTELNDEEEIRGLKDFVLDIDNFIKLLDDNRDKIQNIEYLVDENINFKLGGNIIGFKDAIKDYNPVELNIKG